MWRGARCTHTNKPEVKCPTGGASGTAYSCSVGWQRSQNYSVTVCRNGYCSDEICCNRLHQYLSLRICEPGARLNIVAFLPLIFFSSSQNVPMGLLSNQTIRAATSMGAIVRSFSVLPNKAGFPCLHQAALGMISGANLACAITRRAANVSIPETAPSRCR